MSRSTRKCWRIKSKLLMLVMLKKNMMSSNFIIQHHNHWLNLPRLSYKIFIVCHDSVTWLFKKSIKVRLFLTIFAFNPWVLCLSKFKLKSDLKIPWKQNISKCRSFPLDARNSNVKCGKCKNEFSDKRNLKKHPKIVMKQETQVFSCENFKNKFLSVMNLKKHLRIVYEAGTHVFTCEKCINEFPRIMNL